MEKTKDAEETIEIRIHGGKFKQFDIMEEAASFSDHHYYNCRPKKYSDQWRNTISQEWDILKNRLPDSIFVRASRERPDLLRAVIIGPQGSPYHDGLFFFDIQFPSKYPDVPPKIHYCCYDVVSMNRYIQSDFVKELFLKGKDTLIILLLTIHESQVYTANTLLY
ncbi:putative ubiquitin-conjugating enzyme E2 38 [Papaver somniferum]|uniref:putative ubiquitin-conjugating enzyme E2 38 n=1 Tax=Papaver somniferum TaxID=3469 RepID=UPI000E6F99FD|nr:putative ubiquitin-conjugating enzyme E2 38 [Papaver somniferum]